MIPVKTLRITTAREAEELLSSLAWQLHPTENLITAKTSRFSIDTIRGLVGRIDKLNNRFSVSRVRSLFQYFLPQIVVDGQLLPRAGKTEVKLTYKLGLLASAFCLMLVYATLQVSWQTFTEVRDGEDFLDGVIWLLLFPVGFVLLTLYEINKATDRLYAILRIEEVEENAR